MAIDTRAPPIIDFSPFYSSDATVRTRLVEQIRNACEAKGFFQITNHGVPQELQDAIFWQSQQLFALPREDKLKMDRSLHPSSNRGYEGLRSQKFEQEGRGDLKEAFALGEDLPPGHPFVLAKKFNMGSNVYPSKTSMPDFKDVTDRYLQAMITLAKDLLQVIALGLGLEQSWFEDFSKQPIATLRLLHYPPQEPDADEYERGIGAHTDFGGITLLLQDSVGGLQVYDKDTSSWIDVKPTPGAYVINLGNLMMRWSNDKYISNLHRVINASGRERYSIPFFFAGNVDFMVECLPGCEDPQKGAKYPPIKVGDWMSGRYADTYVDGDKEKAMKDLSTHLRTAA